MQREEIRNKIIEVAILDFHNRGVKNVTMDSIAHKLTMSKRTLYQIFSDKEDLLLACIQKKQEEEHDNLTRLREETDNVLDLILISFSNKMNNIKKIQPEFFTDILKYPRVVEYYEKTSTERESEAIDFLNKGKEQGFFRKEVNFHIIYKIISTSLDLMLRMPDLGNYSQVELFESAVVNYFRGCATIKGFEIIDKFMDHFHDRIEQ